MISANNNAVATVWQLFQEFQEQGLQRWNEWEEITRNHGQAAYSKLAIEAYLHKGRELYAQWHECNTNISVNAFFNPARNTELRFINQTLLFIFYDDLLTRLSYLSQQTPTNLKETSWPDGSYSTYYNKLHCAVGDAPMSLILDLDGALKRIHKEGPLGLTIRSADIIKDFEEHIHENWGDEKNDSCEKIALLMFLRWWQYEYLKATKDKAPIKVEIKTPCLPLHNEKSVKLRISLIKQQETVWKQPTVTIKLLSDKVKIVEQEGQSDETTFVKMITDWVLGERDLEIKISKKQVDAIPDDCVKFSILIRDELHDEVPINQGETGFEFIPCLPSYPRISALINNDDPLDKWHRVRLGDVVRTISALGVTQGYIIYVIRDPGFRKLADQANSIVTDFISNLQIEDGDKTDIAIRQHRPKPGVLIAEDIKTQLEPKISFILLEEVGSVHDAMTRKHEIIQQANNTPVWLFNLDEFFKDILQNVYIDREAFEALRYNLMPFNENRLPNVICKGLAESVRSLNFPYLDGEIVDDVWNSPESEFAIKKAKVRLSERLEEACGKLEPHQKKVLNALGKALKTFNDAVAPSTIVMSYEGASPDETPLGITLDELYEKRWCDKKEELLYTFTSAAHWKYARELKL